MATWIRGTATTGPDQEDGNHDAMNATGKGAA